jgi:GNAT superfamily N-acetyltransferase
MDLTVGPAAPDELNPARDVWLRANTGRGKFPGEERIARVAQKLADPAATVVVARDGTAVVVGMALAEPGREPGRCHVSMVFVDPDRWGQGIGALLLGALAGLAPGQELQLWTGEGNERAQRLYRRCGFEPSGRRKLLSTGEPVIHLIRRVRHG